MDLLYLFSNFIEMESFTIYSFVSGFFYSILSPQVSPMLCVEQFILFITAYFTLSTYLSTYLPIFLLLVDISIVSNLGPLYKTLLKLFLCAFGGYKLLILLGAVYRDKLLHYKVCRYLGFRTYRNTLPM